MNELVHSLGGEAVVGAGDIEAGKPDASGNSERAQIVTTMPIADIKVGTRHRKDMGDIAALARNISEIGLLHPIVVTPDGTLIVGGRRLAAYKQLGRTDIPVTVVDIAEIARGELAENFHRKDFLPTEIDAIRRALAPIEEAAAKERMSQGGKVGKISTPSDAGKTRDKIGAFVGISGRTVEKIAAVVDAAEAEPAKFGHLVDEMDASGKADRAYQQLKVERQREANAARGGRSPTPSTPKKKGVPGWADTWAKATPKQRQTFVEKVGLQAIVAVATEEQKATIPSTVSNPPKEAPPPVAVAAEAAPVMQQPLPLLRSTTEIIRLAEKVRRQTQQRDVIELCDWVLAQAPRLHAHEAR
jgi:ParB-like chromosome segregation protein Spo0J